MVTQQETEKSPPQLRLLVVDDHQMVADSLVRSLEEQQFVVSGMCRSLDQVFEREDLKAIDVVLLDYDLGGEYATAFLPKARKLGFAGQVLIITAWVSDEEVRRLVAQGVSGVFEKDRPLSDLREAILQVSEGGTWFEKKHWAVLLQRSDGSEENGGAVNLSPRERRVVRCLLEGMSNKEMAAALDITESTVKAVLQRLFEKSGVRTRTQLVLRALEEQWDV